MSSFYDQGKHAVDLLAQFVDAPLERQLKKHCEVDVHAELLHFFHGCIAQVSAYRDFVARHGIQPEAIKSFADYQNLPLATKQNYMQAYPLPQRCRDGKLSQCDAVAVSSGSTGTPTIWPRALKHELDIALRFEHVFKHSFFAHQRSTLAVVCFALGNWVGGMFTTACCRYLAFKGYPVTVATPGNNKEEIFRIVRELGVHFDQVVLLGYPPFVKDVIDAGREQGVEWPRYNLKMVFAGEVFSEEWRTLVGERAGCGAPCYDTATLYGTADGGVLGNETPYSIAIRRFLAAHPQAARELFGESRLPTLVQYDPLSRYFETRDGTLVVSGDNGVPLVRYHIADKGGVLSHKQMLEFLLDWGCLSLQEYGLDSDDGHVALPFVYVFGRADFTVSYYGANIYPENVTVALEQSPIQEWVTGKFVLQCCDAEDSDKTLRITVELAPGIAADDEKAHALAQAIRDQLLRLNSEFANYVPPSRQLPQLVLRSFGDPVYFPVGVKHRYTRSE